ncbi:sialidase-3-like [Chanos chanos]|uniref:exo-alpha-sialidase n=1 Tax=Chanos chanos TaxID=29144 RepID=A0A6J2VGQ7_CHACN|nr:sialidase-3-like [Chanos chanos]
MGQGSSESSPPTVGVKQTVFRKNSKVIYRIPALFYFEEKEMFLAFAEKRSGPRDEDAEVLVMSKLHKGDNQWSEPGELQKAHMKPCRTMSPCPVYERTTKTLYLFFNCVYDKVPERTQIDKKINLARLCYITTKDAQTWSEVTDLTDVGEIGEKVKDWSTFAIGPGHGIQTENNTLIIPAYAYHKDTKKPHAFVFSSSDIGKTWHVEKRIEEECGECQVAEVIDSKGSHLYCNARGSKVRVEAVSENYGKTFGKAKHPKVLTEPKYGCQGSVIAFQPRVDKTQTWLLFTHPSDKKERKDVAVYLNKSPFNSDAWEKKRTINGGRSAYSDVVYVEKEDHFACLVECGKNSEYDQIDFLRCTPGDLGLDTL